jgi:hypothetical protein
MKIEQKRYSKDEGWVDLSSADLKEEAQVVFVFGGRALIEDKQNYGAIKGFYPKADVLMCSTAGEIIDTRVSDNSLSVTAVKFNKTALAFTEGEISDPEQSSEVGKKLASKLKQDGLTHVMVFSDGSLVNGTALVEGILSKLPPNVAVTGGLVGDGKDFKKTAVGLNQAGVSGKIILLGFYGDSIVIGYGSLGGWDTFGHERIITKSKNNVLFELDDKPALALYKEYLGDQAKGLPSTGLLFPLSLRLHTDKGDEEVVRTILGVNEKDQSMTFAGDMPEGVPAKLMKANFERLIDGASGAASMSRENLQKAPPELAILISCIGRKLVLGARVEEEVEAVKTTLGDQAKIAGFYSYGEISPVAPTEKQCRLHNQTMTITTFTEK